MKAEVMKRTLETDGMAARKRKRLKMKRRNKHDFQMKNRKSAPRRVNFSCASCAFSRPWLCLLSGGWVGWRQSLAGQSDPKRALIGRGFHNLCNHLEINHLHVKHGQAGPSESNWIQAVQDLVTLTRTARRAYFENPIIERSPANGSAEPRPTKT